MARSIIRALDMVWKGLQTVHKLPATLSLFPSMPSLASQPSGGHPWSQAGQARRSKVGHPETESRDQAYRLLSSIFWLEFRSFSETDVKSLPERLFQAFLSSSRLFTPSVFISPSIRLFKSPQSLFGKPQASQEGLDYSYFVRNRKIAAREPNIFLAKRSSMENPSEKCVLLR